MIDNNLQVNTNDSRIVQRVPADSLLSAYCDENFQVVDAQCCTCLTPTLNLTKCSHFLCQECCSRWKAVCFLKRKDLTCPYCVQVITPFDSSYVDQGEKDELIEYDIIYDDGHNEVEVFRFDPNHTYVEGGRLVNPRYTIGLLFTTLEYRYERTFMIELMKKIIMADAMHDIVYMMLTKLFNLGREILLAWVCTHVSFDFHLPLRALDNESVITRIMRCGYYEIARKLFQDKMCDINENSGEYTLLAFSIVDKDYDMTRFMVAQGADVNDTYGETHPLSWALDYSAPIDLIQFLIDSGANVNYIDRDGHSLLFRVITREYDNKARLLKPYIKLLLSNGCDDTRMEWVRHHETGKWMEQDVYEFLEEGVFTRREWNKIKTCLVKVRNAKRKRNQ